MTKYQMNKNKTRIEAREFQIEKRMKRMDYMQIAVRSRALEKKAIRYGLCREFQLAGII